MTSENLPLGVLHQPQGRLGLAMSNRASIEALQKAFQLCQSRLPPMLIEATTSQWSARRMPSNSNIEMTLDKELQCTGGVVVTWIVAIESIFDPPRVQFPASAGIFFSWRTGVDRCGHTTKEQSKY